MYTFVVIGCVVACVGWIAWRAEKNRQDKKDPELDERTIRERRAVFERDRDMHEEERAQRSAYESETYARD
jgi:hypothetical protein